MKTILVIFCLMILSSFAQDQNNDDGFGQLMNQFVNEVQTNASLMDAFNKHFQEYSKLDTEPAIPAFPCKARQVRTNPNSVHELTPADIDVVAALGDSISAAFGAKARTVPELLLEWRGKSWSIGGDGSLEEGDITLPNVIKKFNPKVKGFSTGVIPVLTMDIFKSKTKFNVAVSGAKAKNIFSQAEMLVKRMRSDHTVNIDEDWKLVTLFIGGNDLCAFCKDSNQYSYNNYQENIRKTMAYLQDNLPRTLVNLVLMLDVTQLSEINDGLVCNLLHRVACKCASFPKSNVAKDAIIVEAVEYSETILDLLGDGAFDQSDNFTVVAQPFLVNQRLPANSKGEPDLSFFAPDCFHFSARGHASSAQALWNNMLEPAGKKRLSWFNDEKWHCPTDENPYIFTYKNSFQPQKRSGDLLGAQPRNQNQQSEPNKEMTKNQTSKTKSVNAILPAVLGACAGVILSVIAMLIITKLYKRRRSTEERKSLLH